MSELTEEIVEARTNLIFEERTGFLRPKFGEDYLEKEIEVCKRYKRDFTIALLDVDSLKAINDRFGHLAGTKAITDLTSAIKKSVRTSDIISRYGGDEFLIIFTNTTMKDAQISVRRIEEELEKINAQGDFEVCFSSGLAQFRSQKPVTLSTLIEQADRKLYIAKKNRKNPNV